ncbi:hypothetical protein [Clostridium felsineum]|nr:hypothetical protein [Clostridium felsineum]
MKRINFYWQNTFDYKPSDKGTESQVILDASLKNSGKISIYHINDKSFIKTDPDIFDKINDYINSYYLYKSVYAKDFENYFKDAVQTDESCYFCYLTEPSYVSDILSNEYSVRKLSSVDSQLLENFKKSCWDLKLKINLPDINSPVMLGCFYNNSLVCISSISYFKNDIADLNIISHPSFKDNSIIAKTLIAELCQFCFKEGKVLQYKFSSKNKYAKKISQSMGFNLYVINENLILK